MTTSPSTDQQSRVRAQFSARDIYMLLTFKPAAVDYLSGYSTTAPGKVGLALTAGDVRLRAAQSEVGRALHAPGVTPIDTFG
jgi:hypothetical protein